MPATRLAVHDFLARPGLTPHDLAMVFLMREEDDERPRPMPTLTMPELPDAVDALTAAGVTAVKVFAGSRLRDSRASAASDAEGLAARSITAIKTAAPDIVVMTETCVCSHNDSGECWLPDDDRRIDVRATTDVMAAQAVMQADAGADIVGPAAMLPGSVRAVRQALDAAGHSRVAIMPHLIFDSHLYDGYRASMDAAPRSGARAFQINPGQPEQAVRVAREMVAEGADLILTEPALHTVDTLVRLKSEVTVPLVPFSVSGEYLRLTDTFENGRRSMRGLIEAYTVLKRAGAARVITYGALEIVRELSGS